ncbi:MAG: GNAT family N-acetyltransferase [Bacteroidaceae bacterium]|nr:GNAT family N-acetyltransferase [Bacteroidaceae bacterium]
MEIRRAKVEDVPQIVKNHEDAFEGFFLTTLGSRFLQFYYRAFVNSQDGVVYCAVENGHVLGFSAATKQCRGFNTRLIKNNILSFFVLAVKLMFTQPGALIRLAKNLTKKSDEVVDNEDYAELYSIGVSSEAQGKGIGKKLLYATESALKDEGVDKVSLTTDYNNNESAVAFYHSMGYSTLYEFIAYPNRKMYRLIKVL